MYSIPNAKLLKRACQTYCISSLMISLKNRYLNVISKTKVKREISGNNPALPKLLAKN